MAGLFEQIKQNTKAQLPAAWASVLEPGTAAYELAVLLNAKNKLPSISFNADMRENGTYSKADNALVLNSNLSSPLKKNTLAHELTHALNYTMQEEARNLYAKAEKQGERSLSQSEQQFVNGWQKLDPDFSKLKKLNYPGSYNDYRHSFKEAPAWAVGNMEVTTPVRTPGGSHVDATLAQEQAILRDLQARMVQQQQQQEASTPWYKDPFGFTIK